MAITPLNIIFSWFETGDFPTEQQFQATWTSFWHKSEDIPMNQIIGLNDALNSYVLKSTFNSHLNDPNAHNGVLIPLTQKGAHNGVATLNGAGKIPESQLPSYVDDVVEGYLIAEQFFDEEQNLIDGERGKIYVDLNAEKCYRWSGSIFVEVSSGVDDDNLVHKTGDELITGQKQFTNPDNRYVVGDALLQKGYYADEYGLIEKSSEYALVTANNYFINFAGGLAGNLSEDGLNRHKKTLNYGLDYEPGEDKLSVGGEVKADGFKVAAPTSSTLLDHESLKLMNNANDRVTHKLKSDRIYTIRYGAYQSAEGRGLPMTEDRGCDIMRFNLTTNTFSVGAAYISAGATSELQPIKMKLHYTPEPDNQDQVVTIGSGNFIGKKRLSDIAMSFRPAEVATGGQYEYSDGVTVHTCPIFTKTIKVFGTEASMDIGGIPISVNVFSNLGHVGVTDEIRSDAQLKYSIARNHDGTMGINAIYNDEMGGLVEIFIHAVYAYADPIPERID